MKREFNKLHKISFANIVDTKCVTINTLLNETDCNLTLNEGIMNQAYSLSLKMQSNAFQIHLLEKTHSRLV